MASKRRKFSPSFKARVALDALKERESLAQLASKHGVHANQVSKWKKELLQSAPGVFAGAAEKRRDGGREREEAQLFEKIGRVEMENEWLRKKLAPYQ